MSGSRALDLAGQAGDRDSRVHALDPRAKIVALGLVTLVAISTPLAAWPVYVACATALAGVAAAASVPATAIWRRARVVLPLIVFVAIFVPFVRAGGRSFELGPVSVSEAGLTVFAAVTIKATIGTLSAVLLATTTSFPTLLRGLERMRVPRLLTLIAAFTYRYLFVIVEEAARMRAALRARAYRPRHALAAGAIGRLVAALFLRSYARGERVYLAMTARGFTGSMPAAAPLRFLRSDAAFVVLVGAPLLGLRVLTEALR